jgi:hypothetical protein
MTNEELLEIVKDTIQHIKKDVFFIDENGNAFLIEDSNAIANHWRSTKPNLFLAKADSVSPLTNENSEGCTGDAHEKKRARTA